MDLLDRLVGRRRPRPRPGRQVLDFSAAPSWEHDAGTVHLLALAVDPSDRAIAVPRTTTCATRCVRVA
ncbi:hypothetical protein [Georgenia yuyongxinii]